jgi:hypothetical protein
VLVGLILAYAVRKAPTTKPANPVVKTVALVFLLAGGLLLAHQVEKFLHINSLNTNSANSVLDRINHNLSHQNSAGYGLSAGSSPVHHLSQYPGAIITVLYRPFPWEAPDSTSLAASIESSMFLVFTVLSLRRMGRAVKSMRRNPYVLLVLAYLAAFVYGYASFHNFGLLDRQRASQALPFLFVLVAGIRSGASKPGQAPTRPPPPPVRRRPRDPFGDADLRAQRRVPIAALDPGRAA